MSKGKKDQAYFCDKAMKGATMNITPNAELIELTFRDGSYLTILTERKVEEAETEAQLERVLR